MVSEERVADRFAFIYPTEAYVRKSNLPTADCLHLKSTVWGTSTFPRKSFYHMDAHRDVSHSKMIIVTKDDKGIIDDDTMLYFGSHNFSSAAWGREEKHGFCIQNWELGVVFPP